SETKDKYELYPTPHSVEYGEGELTLDKEIEVVYDDTIDDVTKEKLSTIFKENDLSDPKVVDEPSADTITIYIGTDGSDGPAETNGNKIDMYVVRPDAYQLDISADFITVIGKDTDASFYGITSLEKILDQRQANTIKNMEIKDYANTEVRGFIEGFY